MRGVKLLGANFVKARAAVKPATPPPRMRMSIEIYMMNQKDELNKIKGKRINGMEILSECFAQHTVLCYSCLLPSLLILHREW
jgi:hypothetical protein